MSVAVNANSGPTVEEVCTWDLSASVLIRGSRISLRILLYARKGIHLEGPAHIALTAALVRSNKVISSLSATRRYNVSVLTVYLILPPGLNASGTQVAQQRIPESMSPRLTSTIRAGPVEQSMLYVKTLDLREMM